MNSSSAELFRHWFAALEREHIPYVILHSYQDYPDQITSDVDYAVPADQLTRLPEIEQAVAKQCGWVVAQRLVHESCAYSAIWMNPTTPTESLTLDVTSHYVRNGCFFLTAEDLLQDRRRYKDFFIASPATEFIYTWVKLFAKKKPAAPYVARLAELQRAEPERSQQLFTQIFGAAAGTATEWLARPVAEWPQLESEMSKRHRYTLTHRRAEWHRRWQRLWRPTGLTIAFLGPDGTGKSTVIANVINLLRPCFRQHTLIHFNPRFGKTPGNPTVTNPHAQPPRSAVMSWLKVLFYFTRHWMHWAIKQVPARVRSTLIIYDRTFEDMLVDPRRYRLQKSTWLVRGLARGLPAPDITFILTAPDELIHQRKAELSVPEIARQQKVLQLLATQADRVTISAAAPAQMVAAAVFGKILTHLAHRSACRK